MDWLLILVLLAGVYTAIAFVIHRNKLWEERYRLLWPDYGVKDKSGRFF